MKSKILVFILFFDMVLLLGLSSCLDLESASQSGYSNRTGNVSGASVSQDKWQQMVNSNAEGQNSHTKQDKNSVYVVSCSPQGDIGSIDEVDEISITFSEPVVAMQKIQTNTTSLFTFSPAIEGEGYWKSTTTYSFRVAGKLDRASEYVVRFNGFKSFSGKDVPVKQWSFKPLSAFLNINQLYPEYESKGIAVDQKVIATFSEEVDPVKISKFISLRVGNDYQPYKIRYVNKEELDVFYASRDLNLKKSIIIIPDQVFPKSTSIEVIFANGLPSISGRQKLSGDRHLVFLTTNLFSLSLANTSFRPEDGIKVTFTNPVNEKKFLSKISFEPKVVVEGAVPEQPVSEKQTAANNDQKSGEEVVYTDDNVYDEGGYDEGYDDDGGEYFTSEVVVHANFAPDTNYTMTVQADLVDQYGAKLGTAKKFSLKTLDYSPFFTLSSASNFVFEDYLDKKLPIEVRNVFNVNVYYKELNVAEIKRVSGGYSPQPDNVDIKTCAKYNWQIPIKKNRNYVLGFDLETININKPGFYYIQFTDDADISVSRIFQLTDTALVAKYSPSQVFVAPFNMKTGEIIPKLNFDIESFNAGGSVLAQMGSRSDGTAIYDANIALFNDSRNRLSQCFVFTRPNKSFIWGNKNAMLDFVDYPAANYVPYNDSPSVFNDYMTAFTDKYLYKGGQTVRFKGLVRRIVVDQMTIPTIKGVQVEVINSRNESIRKFALPMTNITLYGSFFSEFVLSPDTPTGFYRIQLLVQLGDANIQRSYPFSVEEYKPLQFEVNVNLEQPSLIASQGFSGKVNGRYLFGTPMKNASGTCIWTIESTYFAPPGWEKYSFGNPDYSGKETIFKKEFTLDDKGDFFFNQGKIKASFNSTAKITVYGEVKDKDNQRISAKKALLLHPGEFYIGLKSSNYFFESGVPGKIMLAAVAPDGKAVPNTNLNVHIYRTGCKSVQKKDASGALWWEWTDFTTDVVQENLQLTTGTTEKEYTFTNPGYYHIAISGTDRLKNQVITKGTFYVTGDGYVSWGVNDGRALDVVTDKNEYKPGEAMKVLIKSPFDAATVLVSVEREKVLWSAVKRLKGNANTVTIPVDKSFIPNVYINVIILKERTGLKFNENGFDTGKPEFYSGYKAVNISAAEKRLNLKVSSSKAIYGPGETVNLDVLVTNANGKPVRSEVLISVVDKGVLALVGYQLPDPFNFFWANRPLFVKTVSTLDDVLGRRQFREKGENPGGDGDGAAFGSIVVRKDFKESVFYTAFVETNDKGIAHVSFTLPDNITTFKAMAQADTKDHCFGVGGQDIVVNKSLILKPAVPNFSRPGDTFSAGVTVTNNSSNDYKVAVEVKYENVAREAGDPDKKIITLKAGETLPVWYKFKITGLKTQKLTFRAAAGKSSDGLYQEIPVRVPVFMEACANFGRVENTPITERIVVPDKTIRELDKVELSLSSSAMVGVKRNFDYLQEYPYGCLEQRLSKAYPLVATSDFLITYGLLNMNKAQVATTVNTFLRLLPRFQHSSGGFMYYPDCLLPSEYLTCYTLNFCLDARDKGYQVDGAMLEQAQNYLKNVCLNTVDSKYPYSRNVRLLVQSYIVYLLARNNMFLADAVNNLYEARDRIPFSGLAYLLKTLNIKNNLPAHMQGVIGKAILNKMKDEPTMTHFENIADNSWEWVHESNIKTTAIVLDAYLTVYGKFPYAEKIARWLAVTSAKNTLLNTQEHLNLFMAFEHYYRVFEKNTPNFVAEVLFNGQPRLKQSFIGRELSTKNQIYGLREFKPNTNVDVTFKREGEGNLYYLMRFKYYPFGGVSAINRGFEVSKTYTNLDGKPVENNTFTAGEKYIVILKVKTSMERSFVMLDDPLPAGFTVLNPNFKTNSELDKEGLESYSWGYFQHYEIYFDRMLAFAEYLFRGEHTYRYMVIATHSGTFTVPNTLVSEMYQPEVFGRNANSIAKINEK